MYPSNATSTSRLIYNTPEYYVLRKYRGKIECIFQTSDYRAAAIKAIELRKIGDPRFSYKVVSDINIRDIRYLGSSIRANFS